MITTSEIKKYRIIKEDDNINPPRYRVDRKEKQFHPFKLRYIWDWNTRILQTSYLEFAELEFHNIETARAYIEAAESKERYYTEIEVT
jgi:hypothetical protein